ncbi:MAG: orotidine 5'-phosphate decarboxylase [Sulfuritalea sp.]|nr:orotidine 5'-phosphate decarboxylase [Sulfuritalea sp.]
MIELGDAVVFYKIGLELFMTGGYFDLLHWLVGQGKKVFVDLKFLDVPETVRSAVRALAAGVDGIVSSGLEAPMIRRELGDKVDGGYAWHSPGREQAGG